MNPNAEKILFVDDDPNLLDACQRVLRKRFHIDTCTSPEAGLTAVDHTGPYAVVVSDMRMPGMDGIQFLAQVRARLPESVRMMMTGFPETQTAIDAVNQGNVFRFLTKPCTPDSLARALEAGLNQFRLRHAQFELLEMKMRHTQKMGLVGQCAAGVAHDLRNVLSIITVHASLGLERPLLQPDIMESFRQIHGAAGNAAKLTQRLMAFCRRQDQVQFGPVDLGQVLPDFCDMLRRMLPRSITLESRCASGLGQVIGDPGMLGQVILNLALNARDAMPDGGQLTILAEPRLITAHSVSNQPDARVGRFACLSISDTGCGMDAATQARIFEPFFTTKAEGQGTGLGLSIVADIMKQHQGWIEVSSQVGQGTTFEIFLPVVGSTALPQP